MAATAIAPNATHAPNTKRRCHSVRRLASACQTLATRYSAGARATPARFGLVRMAIAAAAPEPIADGHAHARCQRRGKRPPRGGWHVAHRPHHRIDHDGPRRQDQGSGCTCRGRSQPPGQHGRADNGQSSQKRNDEIDSPPAAEHLQDRHRQRQARRIDRNNRALLEPGPVAQRRKGPLRLPARAPRARSAGRRRDCRRSRAMTG